MPKLLIALDGLSMIEAIGLSVHVKEHIDGVKLGDLLLRHGVGIVRKFREYGLVVMTDNKWWDIPNTVGNKVELEAKAGADLITINVMCQEESIRAALDAAGESKLVGVTVLTSTPHALSSHQDSVRATDGFFAMMDRAVENGIHGITVPGPYVQATNGAETIDGRKYKDLLFRLTPGVRMPGNDKNDQQMVAEGPPGSEYVVVGRPITKAKDPLAAAKAYRTWLN